MKPFLRASNLWRLAGFAVCLVSVFVPSEQIVTPWLSVSLLGLLGLGLALSPTILEAIARWRGKQ